MSDGIPRRFIAGAVCPRCGAQDRIRVFEQQGQRLRECVACGFHDQLDGQLDAAPGGDLPGGKHDRPRPSRPADGAQPLRFYPPRTSRRTQSDDPASSSKARQPPSPRESDDAKD